MATTTSCTAEIHVNDTGTLFEIALKECSEVVDVSAADVLNLIFKLPDGTLLTKTAIFKTDGTDGIIQYVSIDGDLNQSGKWKIQAKVSFPNETSWKSDIGSFKVFGNLTE